MRKFLAPVMLGLAAQSCAPRPAGFQSPDPASRMDAILHAARTQDHSAIPSLIELLDSDDPVVRLASIRTLERLTGRTLGYDHAAPPEQRGPAVQAWVTWWQTQQPGRPPPQAARASGPHQ